jgi:hypothetical protein
MEITIGKTRRGARLSDALPGQVYVGRPSVLGNPFQVGRDGSREQVIQLYRAWLWRQLRQQGSPQRQALEELLQKATRRGRVELLCWCAPLPCHAEVIRSALIWLADQRGGG